MRLEIVASPNAPDSEVSPTAKASLPPASVLIVRPATHRPARAVLDVFIDGASVTAAVKEAHGAFVLRDLAMALVDLAAFPRGKTSVRYFDQPWEMCVERFGATACLSVYRAGPEPVVAVFDRAVPFTDVVDAVREAIERNLLPGDGPCHSPAVRAELTSACDQLRVLAAIRSADDIRVPDPVPIVVEAERDAPLSFGADFAIRDGGGSPVDPRDIVERSDLHALLFRGRVRAEVRGHAVDLGECHPVLVAERMVELARRAFDAWERGLPLNARGQASGVAIGIRVGADGQLALTLGGAKGHPRRATHTFPALGVSDVLEAALAFGRSLVRAILRRDRSQGANLRLSALRRALREGTEALRDATQTDSKVNPTPEPYRAFAAALDEGRAPLLLAPPGFDQAATKPQTCRLPGARLRYASRWRAIVPGIDLRSTYLCGDRLVVGAASEMWALDRANGKVLWRVDVSRGTSVVTPGGIARLGPDGSLGVHDFVSGTVTLRTRIVPRVGGPVAGAVVHLPGLPRLVVVTEGEHHLVAIDLTTGEPRWRWSWGGVRRRGRDVTRAAPRLKRAGRLLYVTCGDGSLNALDVMTGAVVWRLRDRLRFCTPPTVVHDALYVVAGGAHGVARLYCVDPFSGHVRWSAVVAEPTSPCTVEGTPLAAADAVAVPVRQKTGLALAAFRKADGSVIPSRARVLAPSGTSWLAVDDAFIGNTPAGELVAIGAAGADAGELRWRHVLGPRPLEADVPRRLEPVLRCGALFVPHTDVAVLRPRDGALLGTIAPTEAIPDLLRVDEGCNVYVAEESGHLVAFGALPRLSLV